MLSVSCTACYAQVVGQIHNKSKVYRADSQKVVYQVHNNRKPRTNAHHHCRLLCDCCFHGVVTVSVIFTIARSWVQLPIRPQ